MVDGRGSDPAAPVEGAGLFGAVLEAVDEAVLVTTCDLDTPGPVIVYANPAFARLTGYDRAEMIGRSPRFLQGPATDRAVLNHLRGALERNVSFLGEAINYRSDGSPYRVEWLIAPLRDGGGRLTHWTAIQHDVTGVRRTEAALRQAQEAAEASERRERYLLTELQHRLRRTLAAVRDLARGTRQTAISVESYATHLDGRLGAFARVQNGLMRGGLSGVDLYDLVADELLSVLARDGERSRLLGPTVLLHAKVAEILGQAIHELTTNAVKFGALAVKDGRISVSWWIEGAGGEQDPQLMLEWVETGVRFAAAPPHRGFGLTLVERGLAQELGAEARVLFAPGGLTCRICLSLTEQVLGAA